MEDKLKIVIELIRDNKITNEQALILLKKEVEYLYTPYYYKPYTPIITHVGDTTITTSGENCYKTF